MTVGRNDPCPCGSGKKYKHCCLPREQVISLQAVREERNHEALLDRMIHWVSDLPPESGMADGVLRYFGGSPPEQPTEEQFAEPLDWILFGYRSPATGSTLAERLVREARRLADGEREMALGWARGAVAGYFHVTHAGPGVAHLRRLGDSSQYAVTHKGEGLETGDLMATWLLPVPSGHRFGVYQSFLTVEATRPLEYLLQQELTLLRRQRPDAGWDDLYRECWPRLVEAGIYAPFIGERCELIRVEAHPQVEGATRENPEWAAVAERLTQVLAEADAQPEEVAGGLRLWWDAVHLLRPRISRPEPWVGALIYLLSNRVYGSGETQAEIAGLAGTSAASLGSRAREIAAALELSDRDPRYGDLLDPVFRTSQRIDLQLAAGIGFTPDFR